MKWKGCLSVLACLTGGLVFTSCQKNWSGWDSFVESENLPVEDVSNMRLARDKVALSSSDAAIVAGLHLSASCTKTAVPMASGVVPITGDSGRIVMYAVNYEDGCIIVSATTKFYPVLAVIEHGSFTYANPTGASILLDEMADAIELVGSGLAEPVSISLWESYLEPEQSEPLATKIPDDPYFDVLDRYLEEWYDNDERMYYLYNKPEDMPDAMYESFCSMAENDMAEVSGYPYRECAIITEKHIYESEIKGPFLKTKWNQNSSYSPTYGGKLGCVTVAVGQIMRYYEYPRTYDWSQMPNFVPDDTESVPLTNFLESLRGELHVGSSGGTQDSWAVRVLEDYGYDCQKVSHSGSSFHSYLRKGNPVYMGGMRKDNITIGHAWVCDGYCSTSHSVKYTLYLLAFQQGQPYALEKWFEDTVYVDGPTVTYHMNWGWGGNWDGYYLDCLMQVNGTEYSEYRKDILISGHN